VTVSNATVTNNRATAEGGGLWNSAVGTLTVVDSILSGNSAAGNDADQGGGALFNDGGEMTVIDTSITNNSATGTAGSGGGILATTGSVLHVSGGMISDNRSNRAGGGIEINATAERIAYAALDGITFTGNNTGAAPGNGGALHITGPAQVKASKLTVTNNRATAEGGGLWNSAVGTLTVVDSLLSGNIASGADADQGGGALFNDGGALRLSNSTIGNNSADGAAGSGGGLLATMGSKVWIINSTFETNRANRAGGAIEIKGAPEALVAATIEQVDFTNNSAGAAPGNGGALHITGQANVLINGGMAMGNQATAEGGAFWNSAVGTLTVKNVTFENNSASGADADQGGGALFNDGGTISVYNSSIANNVADGAAGSGGGLLAVAGSMVEIRGGSMISNTANRAGGAIEINGTMTDSVSASISGVDLLNNRAGAAPGNGGALHITGVANVTLNGGVVMGNVAAAEGGGLWNSAVGTLTVDGTLITANQASGNDADQGGGGLFNDGGELMVSNAIIRGNVADGSAGSGGGILNNKGRVTVVDSTIAGNRSNRAGGGVEDNAGNLLRLHNVRLLKNSTGAAPGNGGGLHITGAGTVEVINGTIAENSAAAEGGGLWNSAVGLLTVSGSTFTNNVATGSADDNGGGALYNDGGRLTVSNSTVTDNRAENGNGAALLNGAGTSTMHHVTVSEKEGNAVVNATGTINLANSIVVATGNACVGSISSEGNPNLDSDGSCSATLTGDPMVGMLANNGGKTATLALLDGSPAIDAGNNERCVAAPVNGMDQRGVGRPQGAACDLGAYEAGNDTSGGGGNACAVVPNNSLRNGSFETGQAPWLFFTDSRGAFTVNDQATDCLMAARVQVEQGGSNVQLYQRGLSLLPNSRYRLSFAAYSSTGNDLGVYVHKHLAPYENYGLILNQVNLTTDWQRYTVEFTTNTFAGPVNDARLRFWFAPFAQPGDLYMVDDVRLEMLDGSESALPTVTGQRMTVTDAGLLLGMPAEEFDAEILEAIPNGNIVDDESAILETFLPFVNR